MDARQMTLFDGETVPVTSRSHGVRRRAPGASLAAPVVMSRGARLETDMRVSFAAFWAGLSPERRAELRARVAA